MPKRRGLTPSEWPSADRAAWLRATGSSALLDEHAVASHWRAKTHDQAQYAYGRWLAYLAKSFPVALSSGAAERACRNHMQAYVNALALRIAPMSVAAELNHLILALAAIAPDVDWAWLRQWQYRTQKIARPRETRGKMVHAARLYDLGLRLMCQAEQEANASKKARAFRDGLLIALLAARPLRRRSLSLIQVGRDMSLAGDTYVLSLPRDDTKSNAHIEFPLPRTLTAFVARYLAHYRPMFRCADRHDGLWPSMKGVPLAGDAIFQIICKRTKAAFGFSINPHLFRGIAGTTIAREESGSVLLARDLLTHASLATTSRHYIHCGTLDAGRSHARTIDVLRRVKSAGC